MVVVIDMETMENLDVSAILGENVIVEDKEDIDDDAELVATIDTVLSTVLAGRVRIEEA